MLNVFYHLFLHVPKLHSIYALLFLLLSVVCNHLHLVALQDTDRSPRNSTLPVLLILYNLYQCKNILRVSGTKYIIFVGKLSEVNCAIYNQFYVRNFTGSEGHIIS